MSVDSRVRPGIGIAASRGLLEPMEGHEGGENADIDRSPRVGAGIVID